MARFQTRIAALAIAIVISSAGPAAAENVLRFTGKDARAATMDPHSYAIEDNKGAIYQVYEALLDVDSNLAVVPQLAVAWKIVDPTHSDFQLRRDVRFHDGTLFTAEDVVFSIERARAKTSDFQLRVEGIAALDAIDDRTPSSRCGAGRLRRSCVLRRSGARRSPRPAPGTPRRCARRAACTPWRRR
jgi:peptide/nickel transport system substrate-binding protein